MTRNQPDGAWVCLYVFYFDPMDRLLREVVTPLIRGLRREGRLERYFFVRYWQRGPHLRLRVLPRRQGERLEEELRAAFDRYLSGHPSTTQLDPERYLQLSEFLSRCEPGRPHAGTLERNNSVRTAAYQPEWQTYGGPATMPLVERHFMESSDTALDLIRRPMSRQQRVGLAVAMQMKAALASEATESGAARLLSFKHRLWLQTIGGGPALLDQWQTSYENQRERIARLTRAVARAKAEGDTALHQAVARWQRSVRMLMARLREIEAAGRLETHWPDPCRSILLSCLHMHHNRLGLTLPEEMQANYFAMRSLGDLCGADTEG